MLASMVEFVTRADGLKPLEQAYGFQFAYGNVVGIDPGGVYRALRRSAEFNVGVVFATDGQVSASELAILRDDLSFFPSYLLAPVVRKSTLRAISANKGTSTMRLWLLSTLSWAA